MDLFSPQVDVSKMHKAFIRLRANPYDVAVINAWSCGFVARDGATKFATEFQTTFESCLWELYLHAVLKELKCQIDFSHSSPDFCITGPSRFTIEAVVARNAKGQLPHVIQGLICRHRITPARPVQPAGQKQILSHPRRCRSRRPGASGFRDQSRSSPDPRQNGKP